MNTKLQLWIAQWFHRAFDMSFGNRAWDDLPEDVKQLWLDHAAEFIMDVRAWRQQS